MRALTVRLSLILLLAAAPVVAQTANDKVPSEPMPDASVAENSAESKEDLYEKFVVNRMDDVAVAYEAGKEYIRKYEPIDGPKDKYVAYLKKWVALYEKLSQGKGKFRPDEIDKRVYTSKEVDVRARILYNPEPLYTQEARSNGIQGTITLRAVFRADGHVTNIRTLSRLPSGLTKSAIEAARLINFTPAMKNGRPVSQSVVIIYNFNLR